MPAAAAASDDLAMEGVRCRDIHDVDVVARDQLAPVERAGGEPEVVAREVEPLGDVVRHRRQARPDPGLREVDRDVAVGARVRLTHPAETDDADPDLRHLPTPAYGAEAARPQTSGLTRCSGRRPSTTADRLLERSPEDARLAIRCRGRDVRRDHDVVAPEQRVVRPAAAPAT